MTKELKLVFRAALCVGVAYVGRLLVDGLMAEFPGNARPIDVIGQFLLGLLVLWVFIPSFRDYGVFHQE